MVDKVGTTLPIVAYLCMYLLGREMNIRVVVRKHEGWFIQDDGDVTVLLPTNPRGQVNISSLAGKGPPCWVSLGILR